MHNFSLVIWCPSFEPLPKWGAMKSPNEGRPHDAPKRETAQCTEHSRSAHAEPDYRQAPTRITGCFSPCRMYVRMYAMQCMYVYCVYVYCVYVSVCVCIQLYILYI